jgi:Fungal chitosanase of glycosyl hydrolase group 75
MRNRILWIFLLLAILVFTPSLALAQSSVYTLPSESVSTLKGIQFDKAVPVDESYRQEFELCDRDRCSGDPNNVKALLKFPDGTVFFESKLSLDIDGSWKACNDGGPTGQCPTSYTWADSSNVDSDQFPFIVIPTTDNDGKPNYDFSKKTDVNIGDLGVVVFRNKVVPVFIADGGPSFRLGEGSFALFKELGEDRCTSRNDGHCTKYQDFSIAEEVLFFVFPRSEVSGLNPTNALATVKNEALKRFQKLKTINKTVFKVNEPTSGQVVPINTSVTFSGTADPGVSSIVVTIGPGGPFQIADLKNVGETWSFTVTFRNSGSNRPLTFSAFDSSGSNLGDITSNITVN